MIRKLLSGLLAGLLTVSLCACGGDDTRGEDSQREAQVSETDRNGEQAQEQETQGQRTACEVGAGGNRWRPVLDPGDGTIHLGLG